MKGVPGLFLEALLKSSELELLLEIVIQGLAFAFMVQDFGLKAVLEVMEYFLKFIVLLSVHSFFISGLFVMHSLVIRLFTCQLIDSVALTLKCYKFSGLLCFIYIHVFIHV